MPPFVFRHYCCLHHHRFFLPIFGLPITKIGTRGFRICWFRIWHRFLNLRHLSGTFTEFSAYLVDFVWRQEFYVRDIIYHLWSEIAEIIKLYPVPSRKLNLFIADCLHYCCVVLPCFFIYIYSFSDTFYNLGKCWHHLGKVSDTYIKLKNECHIRNQHIRKPLGTDFDNR